MKNVVISTLQDLNPITTRIEMSRFTCRKGHPISGVEFRQNNCTECKREEQCQHERSSATSDTPFSGFSDTTFLSSPLDSSPSVDSSSSSDFSSSSDSSSSSDFGGGGGFSGGGGGSDF
jgi:uncharacterized membrane protein YgcG